MYGNKIWECSCSCNPEIRVRVMAASLVNGHTQSCGCLRKDVGSSNRIDMTGIRYNRLVGIKYLRTDAKKAIWLFKCDCGKEVARAGPTVRSGGIKSCGCLHSERAREWMRHLKEIGAGEDSVNRFRRDKKWASRPATLYFVQVEDYDKIGITFNLKQRSYLGRFDEVWFTAELPRAIAWAVEQAALKLTILSKPDPLPPEWMEYGGQSELREGLPIDETIELLEDLIKEAEEVGWYKVWARYVGSTFQP